MKIKNINKRLIAGLLGGVILTTPLSLSSCSSSFIYRTAEDGNVHLDNNKKIEYDLVKSLEIVVLEVNGKEIIYLGQKDSNLNYSDVFTGKTIYDNLGVDRISGVKLISNETIEKYLISYGMLKDGYSKKDLESLFKRIKNDYYSEKNKELVKK